MYNEDLSLRATELERELRLYRDLFEFAPCGYVTTRSDGVIREANAEAARILGIEAESLRGRSLTEFVAVEDQLSLHSVLNRLTHGDAAKVVGWEMCVHPQGRPPVPVCADVMAMRDRGGDAREMRWVITDFSEHKQAEQNLERSCDELRLRVAERTAELEQANQALRHEIAERVRVEAVLRDSEHRFQAFTDNSPAAAFMKDADGRYVYGNRTQARALGTSLQGFRGKTDFELFPHDIAQRLRESDARVLATGRSIEITEIAPMGDRGSSHWLVLKFPFTDAHGYSYVGGVAVDITERMRAEQALRESEDKLDSILDSLNDVVWSLSPKTYDLLYLSHAAERLYGRKLDEFFADKDLWLKLIHPDDRGRVLGSLSEFLSKGSSELEYRIVRAGGEVRWVHDRGKVIYGTNGEMLRLDGIVTDITERVRTEAQLIESQRRLKAVFENTQDAILLFDDEARFVDVNPAACALCGNDREHLLGVTVWDITPIPVRRRGRKLWHTFMAVGQQHGGYTITGGDGTIRFVEYRAVANIVPGLHLSIIRDVTERHQAEEALREGASALRRLGAHLESVREDQSARIAREVHDELGGTLTMLKLGIAALLEKTPEHEPLRQKLESLLNLAEASVKTVKRISSALRPPLLDTLGLAATIRRHAEEFSRLTGIRTVLQLPEYIRLSPERSTAIFRIVQEALTNVARHADATEVAIRARKTEGELLVEIADNGRGIVAADLAKTNSFGIYGMRERSQYLGGNLAIQRTADRGTTLALRLPLEP